MRLFDLITQHAVPLVVPSAIPSAEPRLVTLPGPADFVPHIQACPLRYVLGDDLVSACTELSFAGGDRLSGCLDLIRLPAASFWIEWSETARLRALGRCGEAVPQAAVAVPPRVGTLVTATTDGRRGTLRTFWEDPDGTPCLAALETHLALDCDWPLAGRPCLPLEGGLMRIAASDNPALDALLDCIRFRYDTRWAEYYRQAQLGAEAEGQLLRTSLASVARDTPLLIAFSLLLGARNITEVRPVDCRKLNRRRQRRNKRPLLEHLEVRCLLAPAAPDEAAHAMTAGRRRARLHHVRGHLVRRVGQVFWRKTHTRGRSALGKVHSRTVQLSLGPASPTHISAP